MKGDWRKSARMGAKRLWVCLALLLAATFPFLATPSLAKYVLVRTDRAVVRAADAFPLKAIADITGTPEVGQTLTAGLVTPLGATVTYQWQKSLQSAEGYVDISGADSDTYTLEASDVNHYVRVVATGFGSYSGTATSAYTGPITPAPLTAIDPIQGILQVLEILTAGPVTPPEATVTYQWRKSLTSGGTYEDIADTDSPTYTPVQGDIGYYLVVEATGYDGYTGTVTSEPAGPVAPIPVTAIGSTGGLARVGQTLIAGAVSPPGATVDYQWQRRSGDSGTFDDIPGATNNEYMPVLDDIGYYLRVRATGTGSYGGTVFSEPLGPVQAFQLLGIGAITGTAQVGGTLTAGPVSPSAATVSYQWQTCDTADGVYEDITGAVLDTYELTSAEYGKYVRVVAQGTGVDSGSATSAPVGPVGQGQVTAISPIVGSTIIGETLTAGTLTPPDATVDYQWQYSDWSGAEFTNTGTNSPTFTVTTKESGGYIRLIATGKGAYTGTVMAISLSRVTSSAGTITAIGDTGGTAQVGHTLTAGALTPTGAAATYQWQRADTANGVYSDIIGATSSIYVLAGADYQKYIRVVATGSGSYMGSATSSPVGPVISAPITGLGNIAGTTAVGETLTAGALTPANATVTYQWMRSSTLGGPYEDIPGATGKTYTLVPADGGKYLKVSVAGTGPYTGTLTSGYVGPVGTVAIPLTGIGGIGGTVRVGQQLSAGALSPTGATASYQWKRSATADGTYGSISGATSGTYTLTADDYGKYLLVEATGSGDYTGMVTSAHIGPVGEGVLESISDIVGATIVGQTLTAGTVIPIGATVTYQWQVSDTTDSGTWADIVDGIQSSYIVENQWSYRYIRVKVTGTGAYTGTVYSARTVTRVTDGTPTQITDIAIISGTPRVGDTLTAGVLTPASAAATYQWQRADSYNGTYANIPGGTSHSYVLTASDYNKYLRVSATGSGTYTGIVTSLPTGPIAPRPLTSIGAIVGTTTVGRVLTAGATSPVDATVTYQWKRATSAGGTYVDIPGATNRTYTVTEGDSGQYLKVSATGTGAYTGTVLSVHTGPVGSPSTPIDSIAGISGTPQVGQQLAAGPVSPAGATVSYQWQICSTASGVYVDIAGADSGIYVLTTSDHGKYLRVVVTGGGTYTGQVSSDPIGPISPCPVTAIGDISGSTKFGSTLTAGAVTPPGATVTYQWQMSDTADGTTYTNIPGATGTTYVVTSQYSYRYFRVMVTGVGAYSGTVYSAPTPTRASSGDPTPITAIAAISGTGRVGDPLAAGALTPSAATAVYQWQRRAPAEGDFTSIAGATSSTYTPVSGDVGHFMRVLAIGTGNYGGTVISGSFGPIIPDTTPITGIGAVTGVLEVGQTLTAGPLTPAGATATYQWQRYDEAEDQYDDIPGATSISYTLGDDDAGKYIRVIATATGAYSGEVASALVGPVIELPTPIEGIGPISGTPRFGETLTAGVVSPAGATVTYRWLRAGDDGVYDPIAGASQNTYTLTLADIGKYLKVEVTGTDHYSGTAESAPTGRVLAITINIAAITGVTPPAKNQAPDTTVDETSQYTAAISWNPNDTKFFNNVQYTATIVITPKEGYTLEGVAANYFTVSGASSTSNSANSGVVTVVFPIVQ